MFSQKYKNTFRGKRYYTNYQAVKVFHEKKERLEKTTLITITLINTALLIANFVINNLILNIIIHPLYFYLAIVINSVIGTIFYKKVTRKMREEYIEFYEN